MITVQAGLRIGIDDHQSYKMACDDKQDWRWLTMTSRARDRLWWEVELKTAYDDKRDRK
jgi:hypothetical protein